MPEKNQQLGFSNPGTNEAQRMTRMDISANGIGHPQNAIIIVSAYYYSKSQCHHSARLQCIHMWALLHRRDVFSAFTAFCRLSTDHIFMGQFRGKHSELDVVVDPAHLQCHLLADLPTTSGVGRIKTIAGDPLARA